jgi:hypothetical protein
LLLDIAVQPQGNHGLAVRRIKLSLALPSPGVVVDRHDLRLLDVAVQPRGNHGLAVRRIKLSLALPSPGVVVIGTICGILVAKATPVSCSLISQFLREETAAWPSLE